MPEGLSSTGPNPSSFFICTSDTCHPYVKVSFRIQTDDFLKEKDYYVFTQGRISNNKIPHVESHSVTLMRAKLSGIGIPMVK